MRIRFLLTLAAASVLFAMTGAPLHAQSTATAPTNCKDGTTSTATGRGACSGHGGVQKAAAASTAAPAAAPAAAAAPAKATAAPAPAAAPAKASAAPAPAAAAGAAPTGATAKCKDGTYSMAKHHQGACSRHGGVGEWLDK
jgi:hypothetical protein